MGSKTSKEPGSPKGTDRVVVFPFHKRSQSSASPSTPTSKSVPTTQGSASSPKSSSPRGLSSSGYASGKLSPRSQGREMTFSRAGSGRSLEVSSSLESIRERAAEDAIAIDPTPTVASPGVGRGKTLKWGNTFRFSLARWDRGKIGGARLEISMVNLMTKKIDMGILTSLISDISLWINVNGEEKLIQKINDDHLLVDYTDKLQASSRVTNPRDTVLTGSVMPESVIPGSGEKVTVQIPIRHLAVVGMDHISKVSPFVEVKTSNFTMAMDESEEAVGNMDSVRIVSIRLIILRPPASQSTGTEGRSISRGRAFSDPIATTVGDVTPRSREVSSKMDLEGVPRSIHSAGSEHSGEVSRGKKSDRSFSVERSVHSPISRSRKVSIDDLFDGTKTIEGVTLIRNPEGYIPTRHDDPLPPLPHEEEKDVHVQERDVEEKLKEKNSHREDGRNATLSVERTLEGGREGGTEGRTEGRSFVPPSSSPSISVEKDGSPPPASSLIPSFSTETCVRLPSASSPPRSPTSSPLFPRSPSSGSRGLPLPPLPRQKTEVRSEGDAPPPSTTFTSVPFDDIPALESLPQSKSLSSTWIGLSMQSGEEQLPIPVEPIIEFNPLPPPLFVEVSAEPTSTSSLYIDTSPRRSTPEKDLPIATPEVTPGGDVGHREALGFSSGVEGRQKRGGSDEDKKRDVDKGEGKSPLPAVRSLGSSTEETGGRGQTLPSTSHPLSPPSSPISTPRYEDYSSYSQREGIYQSEPSISRPPTDDSFIEASLSRPSTTDSVATISRDPSLSRDVLPPSVSREPSLSREGSDSTTFTRDASFSKSISYGRDVSMVENPSPVGMRMTTLGKFNVFKIPYTQMYRISWCVNLQPNTRKYIEIPRDKIGGDGKFSCFIVFAHRRGRDNTRHGGMVPLDAGGDKLPYTLDIVDKRNRSFVWKTSRSMENKGRFKIGFPNTKTPIYKIYSKTTINIDSQSGLSVTPHPTFSSGKYILTLLAWKSSTLEIGETPEGIKILSE